jgi:hypothetical protein
MAIDPVTAASVAAPVIGGILGNNAGNDARDANNKLYQQALAQFAGINVPTIDSMTISPENYLSAGTLSPEMLQAMGLGDTALAGVSTDPRLQSSQMGALQQLQAIASGNPQAGDMAGFQLARQNAAGELNAQNNKVLQDMQQRGQGGSGAELLAKLMNNQNSAQMLSNQDMQQAQAMQQARLAALQGQANMATNIRGQDYSEAANLANARDAIAKYNAQNSQNVAATNVNAKNNAQATNLQNAQNISNANTTTQNQAQQYNKQLGQQNFNNQLGLAGAKANILTGNAAANKDNAKQVTAGVAGVGKSIGDMFGSFS